MTRGIVTVVVSLAVLAGCSFAPIRITVQDITFSASNSGNNVCYVRIEEAAPVNFTHARYNADATFEGGDPLNPVISIRVFGRSVAPSGEESSDIFCTPRTGVDIALSDPIELQRGVTEPITIGGGNYGDDLADFIAEPVYYLGITVSDGSLVTDQIVTLENGLISVYF